MQFISGRGCWINDMTSLICCVGQSLVLPIVSDSGRGHLKHV